MPVADDNEHLGLLVLRKNTFDEVVRLRLLARVTLVLTCADTATWIRKMASADSTRRGRIIAAPSVWGKSTVTDNDDFVLTYRARR
jgi:hypothetical protein